MSDGACACIDSAWALAPYREAALRAAAYFVLDVVSSIPFDLIIQSDGSSATKVAKVIKVFRLLKVSSRVRNFRPQRRT